VTAATPTVEEEIPLTVLVERDPDLRHGGS
jgi:hypothetical protein